MTIITRLMHSTPSVHQRRSYSRADGPCCRSSSRSSGLSLGAAGSKVIEARPTFDVGRTFPRVPRNPGGRVRSPGVESAHERAPFGTETVATHARSDARFAQSRAGSGPRDHAIALLRYVITHPSGNRWQRSR